MARRSFLRRVRSISCLTALARSPDAIVLGGRHRPRAAGQQGSRAACAVIATEGVRELRRIDVDVRCAGDRRRRHLQRGVAPSRPAFPVLWRAGPPHRLAANPQPRNDRRKSRDRIADRRYATLLDRARRHGDARLARRRTHAAGRGPSLPATARPRSRRARSSRRSAFHCSHRGRVSRRTRCPSASTRISPRSSPPSASSGRTARCGRCARPMAAWRRARCGRRVSRPRSSARPWSSAWLADVDALLARDFTPITDHRGGAGLPPACRGRPPAPLPARDVTRPCRCGWTRYERAARHEFAEGRTRPCATTAPSVTSPARRAISTMSRPCRARSKPRWC